MAVNIQLKDFTANPTPVPADIIYSGNSGDAFNEVKITISQLIAAYPALLSIGSLTTTANEIIYTTAEDVYATAPITAFGLSVLALASGVTTPTAGALATWDANKNLSANNFLPGFQSIVSAAGTTVLTVASPQYTEITGSTTQTVQMPVASTLVAGTPYTIINNSSGSVTVNSSGGNLIQTVQAGAQIDLILLINSGTTAASWQAAYIPDSGVLSITGTANQIIASSATGNVVLSLPQSIATTSAPTFDHLTLTAGTILDANGHIAFVMNSVPNAVNYLGIYNNTAGAPAVIIAGGASTDVGIQYTTQAAGVHVFQSANTSVPWIFQSGTALQHTTNFQFANTAQSRSLVWPDVNGTISVPQMGTFTPVFTSSGGGTATYSTQTGTYTVVGDRCYFDIVLVLSALPSAGTVTIQGLPFTSTESAAPVAFCQNLNAGVVIPPLCNVPATGAYVTLWTWGAGTPAQLTVANCASTSVFVISGFIKIT